jgi:magnesium chelatase subunit D
VNAADLKLAARLAIIPRASALQGDDEEADEQAQEQPAARPAQPELEGAGAQQQEQPPQPQQPQPQPPQPPAGPADADTDADAETDDAQAAEEPEDQPLSLPESFMISPEGVAIEPSVLRFLLKPKHGRSGKHNLVYSQERGRYVKPMLPKGRITRLAVDATLRAAAPYQLSRRKRMPVYKPFYITADDVRVKKLARKSGSCGSHAPFAPASVSVFAACPFDGAPPAPASVLTHAMAGSLVVFVVDASGSMALNRMAAAKVRTYDYIVKFVMYIHKSIIY